MKTVNIYSCSFLLISNCYLYSLLIYNKTTNNMNIKNSNYI